MPHHSEVSARLRSHKIRDVFLFPNLDDRTGNEEIIDLDDVRVTEPDAAAGGGFADGIGVDGAMAPVGVAQVDPPLTERIFRVVAFADLAVGVGVLRVFQLAEYGKLSDGRRSVFADADLVAFHIVALQMHGQREIV